MLNVEILDNKYEVISHLGKGTMGSVYLVKRISDEKEMVVKKLIITSKSGLDEISAMEIFQRESDFLKRFSHPGLPEVYDTFTEDGQNYLVLEYIKGETLEDIINKTPEPFPEDRAIRWTIEIAEILNYLHNSFEKPIVYKDLKPSNIIITPEGKPRLVDFGTSRYYNPDKNSDTHRLGTPGYAAPEQYQKKGQTTPQSDLFSLGVILFQLLTAYDPTITPLKFPSMNSLNQSISDKLEKIVKKAIQLEPVNRYISVMDLKEELDKYIRTKKLPSCSPYKFVKTSDVYSRISLNYKLLTIFVRHLALMINCGFTITAGLDFLYEEVRNAKLRKTISLLREEIKNGSPLHDALGRFPNIFSHLFINMIKAGEREENLKPVLNKLAAFLEEDLKLQRQLRRVTIYPLLIVIITSVIISSLIIITSPSFMALFKGIELAFPLPQKIFSSIATINLFVIISLIPILIIFKSQSGKILFDRIKLSIPLLGSLNKKIALSRFCRAFGALISINVSVAEALTIAVKSTGNKFITHKIEKNRNSEDIYLSLIITDFSPLMIYKIIDTEEENSKLSEIFYKLSDEYNAEIEGKVKKLLLINETILIIAGGFIIWFFIDSLLMPHQYIFSIK